MDSETSEISSNNPSVISSDDGFECVSCIHEYNASELKKCRICASNVCNKCYDNDNVLYFTDWLNECSNCCVGCNRIGCKECIGICYQCANIGDNFDTYCIDCKEFEHIACLYHDWSNCESHTGSGCGICEANKNYHLKQTI